MALLTVDIIKEDLSICYLKTIAACNEIALEEIRHDDDSEDVKIKKTIEIEDFGPFVSELKFQLKTTSSETMYSEDDEYISYKLNVKNYNDLCTQSTTPIVLGLLILPGNKDEWVNCTATELRLKGRMFWLNLQKNDKSQNKDSVMVRIPKSNILNEKNIEKLLESVARGEDL